MPKQVTEAGIRQHLQILIDAPQRIAVCTAGLDETRLSTPPAPKEWSAAEIIGHVRGCSEVWMYSIYAMLVLDAPELAYIHPRDWSKTLNYSRLSFAENYQAYKVGRDALVRVLQGLTLTDWDRSARFTGKVNTFTIYGEAMRMALHDLDHCNQLETMFPAK